MSITLYYDNVEDDLHVNYKKGGIVLFESYEEKGYKQNKPKFFIPGTNFSIKIESNFGFGNNSHLRALIWYNDLPLLNFHNWWDCINYKLSFFEVEPTPEHWKELFSQIINVYNHKDSWNYNNISTGLQELHNALSHPEKITIRNHPWLPPKTVWEEKLSVLHFARKSIELLNELISLKFDDVKYFKDILNSICMKLIPLITTEYKRLYQEKQSAETTNLNRLELCFDAIYIYLKHTKQLNLFFTNL